MFLKSFYRSNVPTLNTLRKSDLDGSSLSLSLSFSLPFTWSPPFFGEHEEDHQTKCLSSQDFWAWSKKVADVNDRLDWWPQVSYHSERANAHPYLYFACPLELATHGSISECIPNDPASSVRTKWTYTCNLILVAKTRWTAFTFRSLEIYSCFNILQSISLHFQIRVIIMYFAWSLKVCSCFFPSIWMTS